MYTWKREDCQGTANKIVIYSLYSVIYSLRSFISIILVFGVVIKEQNKTTQFSFNHRVLSTYEELQPMSSKETINAGGW
jgi:hypothetical protein